MLVFLSRQANFVHHHCQRHHAEPCPARYLTASPPISPFMAAGPERSALDASPLGGSLIHSCSFSSHLCVNHCPVYLWVCFQLPPCIPSIWGRCQVFLPAQTPSWTWQLPLSSPLGRQLFLAFPLCGSPKADLICPFGGQSQRPGVSVVSGCVTDSPRIQCLKTTHIYFLVVSVGRESGQASVGSSDHGLSWDFNQSVPQRSVLIWRLNSAWRVVGRLQFLTGCGTEGLGSLVAIGRAQLLATWVSARWRLA